MSLFVMLFVFMNVWRFSKSGRVCSGDFLDEFSDDDYDVYLIAEGRFLKIILLLVYLVITLALLTTCITACLVMKSKKEDGDVPDRITAMAMPIDHDYNEAMRRGSIDGKTFHMRRPNPNLVFPDSEADLVLTPNAA